MSLKAVCDIISSVGAWVNTVWNDPSGEIIIYAIGVFVLAILFVLIKKKYY